MATNPWATDLNDPVYMHQTPPPPPPPPPVNPGPGGSWQQKMDYLTKTMPGGFPAANLLSLSPEYQGILNAGGTLPDEYAATYDGVTPELEARLEDLVLNTEGLDHLRERATTEGTSAWGDLMLEANELQRAKALDDMARTSNTATAQAFSDIATRGGISRGAAERLATKGAVNAMMGGQGVRRDADLSALGIRSEDEKMKLDLLKALPELEARAYDTQLAKENLWAKAAGQDAANRAQTQQFNISNMIGDIRDRNKYESGRWDTLATAYGAERTAQAQENAGMTYVCTFADSIEPLSEHDKTMLAAFKLWYEKYEPDKAAFYFTHCKGLPSKMRDGGIDPLEVVDFSRTTIKKIELEGFRSAANYYCQRICHYIDIYYPDIECKDYKTF